MSFYGSTDDWAKMEEGEAAEMSAPTDPSPDGGEHADHDGDGDCDEHSTPLHEAAEDEVLIKQSSTRPDAPTQAPVGTRLKRNAQIEYNPYNWRKTLFVVHGRTYISKAFYGVSLLGTCLVLLSGIAGIGLQDDRECRAWCSWFALGTQPHQYMGFILFLIMAFRTNKAYDMYQAGIIAHFKFKTALRRFVDTALNRVARDVVTDEQRSRLIAFAIAFPYAVTADLREERIYDEGSIEHLLSEEDMADLKCAPTMPLFVLESLITMVREYFEPVASGMAVRTMYSSLDSLYGPYGDCDRIKNNPCAFAYIAHLRFLLVAYLVTLPLAMVEQMGWATIPVCWVICYSLMALEMLAVEVENPFGFGTSDLRQHEYNLLIKESILETFDRWKENSLGKSLSKERLGKYSDVQLQIAPDAKWFYW